MSNAKRSPAAGLLEFQRRVLDLQRSAFNGSFQAIDQLQKQQEDMLSKLLQQIPGIPADAGEAIDSWTDSFRKSRQQYFDAAQRGFDLYDELIDRASKPADDD